MNWKSSIHIKNIREIFLKKKKLFSKLRNYYFIFCTILLLIGFQNCSKYPLSYDKLYDIHQNQENQNQTSQSHQNDENQNSAPPSTLPPPNNQQAGTNPDSWKHFFGVGWNGKVLDQITYAKQMGYDGVALLYGASNRTLYSNLPERAGIKYYILDPEILQDLIPVVGLRRIRTQQSYTQEQIAFYEKYMVWKSHDPFPRNIETGWHFSANDFRTNWDFQQQDVIDYVIEQFIVLVKSYENKSIGFTFGGYMVDVPRLSGEFHLWNSATSENSFNTLPDLVPNHEDSSLLHGAITHQYVTYTEGKAAFWKQLNLRLSKEFPGYKRILEPYRIYQPHARDEWLWQINQRADKELLIPDFLSQESSGTHFVDELNLFKSVSNKISASMVGTSEPNELGEYENRLYAAKAAINGSWFNWFGRFGGTGSMPRFLNITEVYPRLKLIRCVPGWDNLNKVPLDQRKWNGEIYSSSNSFVSSDIIYSRHPKKDKIFVVFMNHNGVVRLNPDEKILKIERVDDRFVESINGMLDVQISNGQISLKQNVAIEFDSSRNSVMGSGYIITLEPY